MCLLKQNISYLIVCIDNAFVNYVWLKMNVNCDCESNKYLFFFAFPSCFAAVNVSVNRMVKALTLKLHLANFSKLYCA